MMRAFLALDVPDDVRDRLGSWITAARDLDWPARVRWVPQENLHLTLRFFARLEMDGVPPLMQSLVERFRDVASFDWHIEGAMLFPSNERPHVLTAGVDDSASLGSLARLAEEAAREVGQPPDSRRYRPHLTLGRMRRPRNGRRAASAKDASDWARTLGEAAPISRKACPAHEAVLFRSELGPLGPRYSVLARVSIGS